MFNFFNPGPLLFTDVAGPVDPSGSSDGTPTEILNISELDPVNHAYALGVGVVQQGNVSINIEARNDFLLELQGLAGDDGNFTIAEFTAFAEAAVEEEGGPSPEEIAQFLAILGDTTGKDTTDGATIVSVDETFPVAVAFGGAFAS